MKQLLCIFFLAITSTLYGSENHNIFKTSLIIPCCAKHAHLLFPLLKEYEAQTELPDEVVISLSEFHKVPQELIDALQQERWLFPITLMLSQKKQYAGENRNIACEHATGEIFICQDADDIPHPQRIEIIKYFFNHYPIDHLMHQYYMHNTQITCSSFKLYQNFDAIPLSKPKSYRDAWNIKYIQNGNPAIARHVFEKLKWSKMPKGQDVEYNQRVYAKFSNKIVLRVPLQCYRNYLSSHRIKPQAISGNENRYTPTIIYLD